MGTVLAYFFRKPAASSRIEADPFIIVASTPDEGMAEGKPRDTTRQQVNNEALISKDEIRRFQHDTQEFFNRTVIMLDRQRRLESELETCNERY